MAKKNKHKNTGRSSTPEMQDVQASSAVIANPVAQGLDWGLLLNGRRYWVILGLLTFVAAVIRFWTLSRFDSMVFDEVYFSQYAYNYLTDVTFFDAHPPLSKYIIGTGIWLYNLMPFTETYELTQVELAELSPTARRWVNAVTGTLLVPIAARTVYALWPNRLASLVMAFLVCFEGLLIVESRYGLNNIYIATFGMSALYFLGKVTTAESHKKLYFLAACSAMLGLTYSIKWNGLGFSAVVWGACVLSYILYLRSKYLGLDLTAKPLAVFKAIVKINPFLLIPILLVPGFVLYCLLWIPHISMIPDYGFAEVHHQIFAYHGRVEADAHPYCSSWYGWPVMARPMSYLFEKEVVDGVKMFTDVHLMGNPAIIWLGAASVLLMLPVWDYHLQRALRKGVIHSELMFMSICIGGYAANFLPWAFVSRCLFYYHYIPASLFSLLALAWVITHLLSGRPLLDLCKGWISRGLGIFIVSLILAAFIY